MGLLQYDSNNNRETDASSNESITSDETIPPFINPELKRVPQNLRVMYQNEAETTIKEQLYQGGSIVMLGVKSQTIDRLTAPKQYDEGRTNAKIVESAPRFIPAPEGYKAVRAKYVFKDNKNNITNLLEKTILQEWKKAGLACPEVYETGPNAQYEELKNFGAGIVIEHLGDVNLKKYISNIAIQFGADEAPLIKAYNAFSNMAEMSVKYDTIAGEVLNRPQFRFYKEAKDAADLERLTKKFNVTKEFAQENFYSLNILKDFPNATEKEFELLAPINKLMKDAEKEFGAWSAGIHPKNVMIAGEDEKELKTKIIDANRIKYGPAQEYDWMQIDAYTPIREPMGVLPTQMQYEEHEGIELRLATNMMSEHAKIQWIGSKFREFQKAKGITEESADKKLYRYGQLAQPARFYTNIILANKTLKELSEEKSLTGAIDKSIEYKHHLDAAFKGILGTGAVFKEYDADLKALFERVDTLTRKNYAAVLTDELLAQMEKRANIDYIPEGAENVFV